MDFLVLLQKKVVRIIYGKKAKGHTYPLVEKVKLLTCEYINKYFLSRRMYRIHHGNITVLDGYFIKNSYTHSHNAGQT